MLMAAMLTHCQFPILKPTMKNQRVYFRIVEFFAGKRFPFPSAPPPLIFHFSRSNCNEITGLEMLATQARLTDSFTASVCTWSHNLQAHSPLTE